MTTSKNNPGVLKTLRQLWHLLPPLRPQSWAIAYSLSLAVIIGFLALPCPRIIRHLVNGLFNRADLSVTMSLVLLYVGVVILRLLLGVQQSKVNSSLSKRIATTIRTRILRQTLDSSVGYLEATPSGKTAKLIMSDGGAVANMFCDVCLGGITDVLVIVMVCFAMATISVHLAVISSVIVLMIVAVSSFRSPKLRAIEHEVQEHQRDTGSRLNERIRHVRLIKQSTKESAETEAFATAFVEATTMLEAIGLKRAKKKAFHTGFTTLSGLAIAGYGAHLVMGSKISVGALCEFMAFMGVIQGSIRRVLNYRFSFEDTRHAIDRLHRSSSDPAVIEPDGKEIMPPIAGRIEFQNVSFTYPLVADKNTPNQPILRSASFCIGAGKMVALIGANGSGKSTIASLLLRFFEPSAGTVMIDGANLNLFSRSSFRKQLGMSEQYPRLFHGTIRENLTYVRPDATQDEIDAVIGIVQFEKVLASLPKGLESVIGEEGTSLSTGQKQRLSVARALLAQPRVIILDEALNSVDSESEMRILQQIKSLSYKPTVLVITHNRNILGLFDQVLEVRSGAVSEPNKPNELEPETPAGAPALLPSVV